MYTRILAGLVFPLDWPCHRPAIQKQSRGGREGRYFGEMQGLYSQNLDLWR